VELTENQIRRLTRICTEHQYLLKQPPIGRGSFSVVYEIVDRKTKSHYAIKVVQKGRVDQVRLKNEIEIMKQIHHTNLIFCKEVFDTQDAIYLVLELVKGGELYDKIVDEGEFNEVDAKDIVMQLLSAIEYLHSKGIAHRDLKPENILCVEKKDKTNRKEHIKVGDFGLSKQYITSALVSRVGSPTYVAPEVIESTSYSESVDIWAVGVITYVVLTGCFPFYEENNDFGALYKKILDCNYVFPDEPKLSDIAKSFIRALLVKPEKRPTAAQAKQHPWFFQ